MQAQGGAQVLLDRLHVEAPWLTRPTLVLEDGEQVIRANFRLINDDAAEGHEALHERSLALCELLVAAVPQAQAAAVDTVRGSNGLVKELLAIRSRALNRYRAFARSGAFSSRSRRRATHRSPTP